MKISLNHMNIPAYNKEVSARFFSDIMGLNIIEEDSDFSIVQVNDSLSLLFINSENISGYHIAFQVSENEFDSILNCLNEKNISYGNDPEHIDNMLSDSHPFGGRGIYFTDPNGHLFEVLTLNK